MKSIPMRKIGQNIEDFLDEETRKYFARQKFIKFKKLSENIAKETDFTTTELEAVYLKILNQEKITIQQLKFQLSSMDASIVYAIVKKLAQCHAINIEWTTKGQDGNLSIPEYD